MFFYIIDRSFPGDVIETLRKLYLVTLVAFFKKGSMVQLVMSIFVSVIALAWHFHAMPFRKRFLNMLQGCCLFFVYITLQAGVMIKSTAPDPTAGNALVAAVSVANAIVFCSPVLMFSLVVFRVIPASTRERLFHYLGLDADDVDDDIVAQPSEGKPDGQPGTGAQDAFDSSAMHQPAAVEMTSLGPVTSHTDADADADADADGPQDTASLSSSSSSSSLSSSSSPWSASPDTPALPDVIASTPVEVWVEYRSEDGIPYYSSRNSSQSVWDLPVGAVVIPASAAAAASADSLDFPMAATSQREDADGHLL
jgi:hypothetical protein